MKKLPVDIQAFETIRENDYLYVDKTEYICQMLKGGRFWFLSRPRRFGKSLMVSTLKCFFQNKKHLFKGLCIAKKDQNKNRIQWKEHPIIMLDFNEITHDTPENLKISLHETLTSIAKKNNIIFENKLLKSRFKELILELFRKTGMPIVILIDEYDKPMIDHIGKDIKALEIAKSNRDILKGFLGVIKGGEAAPHIRFVFITGVSKFSRVSIFSELNNLIDITMNKRYSAMMGYTEEELTHYFGSYIKKFSEESGISEQDIAHRLKRYYDGYRFSKNKTKVYNPFSVLRSLDNQEFENYWFETGTPTFLINLLKKRNYNLPTIENLKVGAESFSTYELDNLRPEALLFQTGYVTIKETEEFLYTLGYPNIEVKHSFLKHLMASFTRELDGTESSRFLLLSKYLGEENFDAFFETITAIFASIAYSLKTKRNEAYFHTLFYLMISASGTNVQSEVLTSLGRIDLLVEFEDKIFIMEFKCNHSPEAGLKQIQEKGYAEKYRQSGKKLILMGINFSSKKRNVCGWKVENL